MGFDGIIETGLSYWLGSDKSWDFTVYTTDQKTVVRNVTGYTTSFKVKRNVEDADAAALITAAGVVSGTFNASPALNTQIVTVTLADTDTDTEIEPGLAYWELKRTNDGSEAPLAYGTIELRRAVHVS
jgi:hypothetical protein